MARAPGSLALSRNWSNSSRKAPAFAGAIIALPPTRLRCGRARPGLATRPSPSCCSAQAGHDVFVAAGRPDGLPPSEYPLVPEAILIRGPLTPEDVEVIIAA